jgi:hypothetical protein
VVAIIAHQWFYCSVRVPLLNRYARTHTHIHTNMYTHKHTHTPTYIYTPHTHIHVYVHSASSIPIFFLSFFFFTYLSISSPPLYFPLLSSPFFPPFSSTPSLLSLSHPTIILLPHLFSSPSHFLLYLLPCLPHNNSSHFLIPSSYSYSPFSFSSSTAYFTRLKGSMFVTYLLYFGYMGVISLAIFLITGNHIHSELFRVT